VAPTDNGRLNFARIAGYAIPGSKTRNRSMRFSNLLTPSRHVPARCLLALLCLVPTLAPALECSQVVFRDIRSTVCKVDVRTDRLQLFLADASGKPFKFFQPLAQSLSQQGEQLVFAMNAGMYREDYSPLGLFVANGRQVHRIARLLPA
jgi:uncharacterized protein YigE (DUF2233 family)